MKITKRQLRRLIREWFSDEHDPTTGIRDTLPSSSWAGSAEQSEFDEMSPEFYVDQLMKQEYDSGRYGSVDELLDDGAAYEELAMTALEQYPQLSGDEFDVIWNNAGFVDQT